MTTRSHAEQDEHRQPPVTEPATLDEALHILRRTRHELADQRNELDELRRELDDTNRGLIAFHSELEGARMAEAHLAAIVRSSDDAIISLTPDRTVQTWNEGARRLLGHRPDQITGQPVHQLLPDREQAEFVRRLRAVENGEHVAPYDTRWRHADGSEIDLALTVSALRAADGGLIGYSAVAHDITTRILAQAQLATARAEAEVLADRERIARDLHDMVIQRVFGAGMALQGSLRLIVRPQVAQRIKTVINELDLTIKELRSAIFDLHHQPTQQAASLRAQLLELVNTAQRGLGFAPTTTFTGPIDAAVPDHIAAHVLAVAQEALSNIIRHANATAADIAVEVGDELAVQVTDNGRGLGATSRSSGLSNLRRRAEAFGGRFDITSEAGVGTELRWEIPLPGREGPPQPTDPPLGRP